MPVSGMRTSECKHRLFRTLGILGKVPFGGIISWIFSLFQILESELPFRWTFQAYLVSYSTGGNRPVGCPARSDIPFPKKVSERSEGFFMPPMARKRLETEAQYCFSGSVWGVRGSLLGLDIQDVRSVRMGDCRSSDHLRST